MAGINGLRPLFNTKQVQSVLADFKKKQDDKILKVLQFKGEEFVNKARLSGNYTDRTGNLRSSVGYIILLDGKVVHRNFKGKAAGKEQGERVAHEVSLSYPKGYVLIGVAGMNYAAYVEAKGFDVITGSAPGSNDLIAFFGEI